MESSPTPASNNGERRDILAMMPPKDPNDHYLNHVIEGIETLVRLEPNIPNVWNHRKIEWDYGFTRSGSSIARGTSARVYPHPRSSGLRRRSQNAKTRNALRH